LGGRPSGRTGGKRLTGPLARASGRKGRSAVRDEQAGARVRKADANPVRRLHPLHGKAADTNPYPTLTCRGPPAASLNMEPKEGNGMKRELGWVATIICSAGLLVLPAAAQQRGTRGNYDAANGSSQAYSQRQPDNTPAFGQTREVTSPNDRSRYASAAPAYGRSPSFESERGHSVSRNFDREAYRSHGRHETRNFRRDGWNWR
jgi:hypothetical protein